jgi:hypothetical protein
LSSKTASPIILKTRPKKRAGVEPPASNFGATSPPSLALPSSLRYRFHPISARQVVMKARARTTSAIIE